MITSQPVVIDVMKTVTPPPEGYNAAASIAPSSISKSAFSGNITITGSAFAPSMPIFFGGITSSGVAFPMSAEAYTNSNGSFTKAFAYPGGGQLDQTISRSAPGTVITIYVTNNINQVPVTLTVEA